MYTLYQKLVRKNIYCKRCCNCCSPSNLPNPTQEPLMDITLASVKTGQQLCNCIWMGYCLGYCHQKTSFSTRSFPAEASDSLNPLPHSSH